MDKIILKIITGEYSLLRLSPGTEVPSWVFAETFFSITRTSDELSILVGSQSTRNLPKDIKVETGWACLKVDGVLDFSLTGILAAIANPLAQNKISIFAISTFDTDYVLVKKNQLESAIRVLKNNHLDVI